jgi:pimeloyl-ACP methyl ester carboxylesterase
VGKVLSVNLSGQEGRQTNPGVTLGESVAAIADLARARGLKDLILVGHGVAAPLALRTAASLDIPLRRVVLLGGIIPRERRSLLSVVPLPLRMTFSLMTTFNGSRRKGLKLPKAAIGGLLCSGLGPDEVIQILGFFQPLPVRLLKSRVALRDVEVPCPISYVVLTEDRLLPTQLQRRMALRVGPADMVDLDACHAAMLHRPKELAEILMRYA